MPRVYNKRDPNIPPGAVLIDRSTKYGNPFTHLSSKTKAIYKVPTREDSVEYYRLWFNEALEAEPLRESIQELKGKDLICWCAPNGGVTTDDPPICHGQVLLDIANEDSYIDKVTRDRELTPEDEELLRGLLDKE